MIDQLRFLLLFLCLCCLGCDKPSETAGREEGAAGAAAEPSHDVSTDEEAFDPDSYLGSFEDGYVAEYLMLVTGAGIGSSRYHYTYTIDGTEEIKGKTYQKVLVDTGGDPAVDDYVDYWRKGDDGYYMVFGNDGSKTECRSFPSPFPTEVGSSWEMDVPDEQPAEARIVGYEDLEILGVSYKSCMKLQAGFGNYVYTSWLYPGKGGVKWVYDFDDVVVVFLLKPDKEAADKEAAASDEPTALEN